MAKKRPKRFDPDDDFDAVADAIRCHVAHMYIQTLADPRFAGLTREDQVSCFVAGMVTGLMGVILAQVTPDGRDAVITMLADYLPEARRNAEGIMREGLH